MVLEHLMRFGSIEPLTALREYGCYRLGAIIFRDMARWSNKHQIYPKCDFKDYEARKGFKCSKYFIENDTR